MKWFSGRLRCQGRAAQVHLRAGAAPSQLLQPVSDDSRAQAPCFAGFPSRLSTLPTSLWQHIKYRCQLGPTDVAVPTHNRASTSIGH